MIYDVTQLLLVMQVKRKVPPDQVGWPMELPMLYFRAMVVQFCVPVREL